MHGHRTTGVHKFDNGARRGQSRSRRQRSHQTAEQPPLRSGAIRRKSWGSVHKPQGRCACVAAFASLDTRHTYAWGLDASAACPVGRLSRSNSRRATDRNTHSDTHSDTHTHKTHTRRARTSTQHLGGVRRGTCTRNVNANPRAEGGPSTNTTAAPDLKRVRSYRSTLRWYRFSTRGA